MKKHVYTLRVGGEEVQLRLTMAGQRALRKEWDEEIMPFLVSAAADGERFCSLLTQCLNWEGNENSVTDGAELYDLLVDEGWQGQAVFTALTFDLAAESGLLTREQADTLTETVLHAYDTAFASLEEA